MKARDHIGVATTHLAEASLRLADARCHLDNAIVDGAIPTRTQAAQVNKIADLINQINNLQKEARTWRLN